jgi:hypothetical protein
MGVFIPTSELPTVEVSYSNKGRWYSGLMWHAHRIDGVEGIELQETEVCENLSKALADHEAAQEQLQIATKRLDTLRMFARKLYGAPKLKAVSE